MGIRLKPYKICLILGVFLTVFEGSYTFAVLILHVLKGSSFQRRAAAIANDLSPQLRFDFASLRRCLFPERSVSIGE